MPFISAFALRGDLIEHNQLRVVPIFRSKRRNADFAQLSCEGELLLRVDGLLPEKEHPVHAQSHFDSGDGSGIQRGSQVDAGNRGTDAWIRLLDNQVSHTGSPSLHAPSFESESLQVDYVPQFLAAQIPL
jgi:hypothetical protein